MTDVAPMIFDALAKRASSTTSRTTPTAIPSAGAAAPTWSSASPTEWYISAEEIRPRMLRASSEVEWTPEYAGKRMENWLENMGDWNISRKRYWGLVLPSMSATTAARLPWPAHVPTCANWRSTPK